MCVFDAPGGCRLLIRLHTHVRARTSTKRALSRRPARNLGTLSAATAVEWAPPGPFGGTDRRRMNTHWNSPQVPGSCNNARFVQQRQPVAYKASARSTSNNTDHNYNATNTKRKWLTADNVDNRGPGRTPPISRCSRTSGGANLPSWSCEASLSTPSLTSTAA